MEHDEGDAQHPDDEGDDVNPFAGLPMFGDLARALAGQGPLNWEAAKQFAAFATTGGAGTSTSNVDPAIRFALADLASVADMHVRDLTDIDRATPEIAVSMPGAWAQQTLDDFRPLFTELATSLNQRPPADPAVGDDDDPMMAMMANLSQMMAPAMLGMAVGSMVGRLATRAFGQYDLPIPRMGSSLVLVPATIDAFAGEWALPVDEMRMWVLAHQLTQHAVFSVGHVRETVGALVRQHVGGFRPDPAAVADKLMSVDDDETDPMKAMQRALGDPELLLGAVRSPAQIALQPVLDATIAAVIGYVDYIVDAVAARLIGGDALRLAEAVRRRRIEVAPEDVFVERLLGLQIDARQVQRGKDFVMGVVDRVGERELSELFARPGSLPTPAEIEAPGLWLARLDIDG